MNIIAVDIGNTNLHMGLFMHDEQVSIDSVPGKDTAKVRAALSAAWDQCPPVASSAEGKRDGVIVVSSVHPERTDTFRRLVRDALDERIYLIGEDIELPIAAWVDAPNTIGTDRLIAAAAAYAVAENAVVVADFGTAVTIDMVDAQGVFQGGVIFPGFDLAAQSLKDHTAKLPRVTVSRPSEPLGKNTQDAINCGLYFSAVGALQEVVRRFAEKLGTWPQTVITGSGAQIIHQDCEFIDSYVPHMVIKGIVLAYKKHLEEQR
ncbi:MAG: type III pantothenate kinase [Phycisphaerae bacterium]|nr:type III pantothenate kinase [Phycisphaerae bacterium]